MGLRQLIMFWVTAVRDIISLCTYVAYVYFMVAFRWIFPKPLKSLEGEVILVTGAGNGVGREICLALKDSKAKIICWDIDDRGNEGIVQELTAAGATTYRYDIDVSDQFQVQAVAEKIKKDIGIVTMIINNAGISPCHKFLSHNIKEMKRAFEVNVFSQIYILREFLPGMMKANRGHIVTMSSISGLIGSRFMSIYCASKHALEGMIEGLKDELWNSRGIGHEYGCDTYKNTIHFTTVYPSFVDDQAERNSRFHSRLKFFTSHLISPEYIAQRVVEGIRRNEEQVYIPSMFVKAIGSYIRVLPSSIVWAVRSVADVYAEPSSHMNGSL